MIDFSKIPPPDDPKDAKGVVYSLHTGDPPGEVIRSNTNILDLESAQRAIGLFDEGIARFEQLANELVVDTAQKAKVATELAAQALTLSDKIEALRKDKIKEPDSFVRRLNAFVKPMRDRIERIAGKNGTLKRKLGDYAKKVELDRRAAEKAQQDAARKLQDELNAEAKTRGVEPVQVAPVVVPMNSGPIRSSSGSASTKMVIFAEITDLSAVPRNYLEGVFKKKTDIDGDDPLDGTTESIWSRLRTLIGEAHTAGLREIPGVNFIEKAEISVRRTG